MFVLSREQAVEIYQPSLTVCLSISLRWCLPSRDPSDQHSDPDDPFWRGWSGTYTANVLLISGVFTDTALTLGAEYWGAYLCAAGSLPTVGLFPVGLEFIYTEHTRGGTEVRGTQWLRPYPEEVRGDQSVRVQVPDVCLLPAQFCTELRDVGFVWMQKKCPMGSPKWDLASILCTLTVHKASKPEASAWLRILKCSNFSTQHKHVHYFGRWL